MTPLMGLDLHKQDIHGSVCQPGQKGTHFRVLNAAWRVWREPRLGHAVDRRRYQKKLRAIRTSLRTGPPYPLIDRRQALTGAEAPAPDHAATAARGQPAVSA
jgi:transposase